MSKNYFMRLLNSDGGAPLDLPFHLAADGSLVPDDDRSTGEIIDLESGSNPTLAAGYVDSQTVKHYVTTPVNLSLDYVHALMHLTAAPQIIKTGITQPDVPRIICIVANDADLNAGSVVFSGADVLGMPLTESLALNGLTPRYSTQAFAQIFSITLPGTGVDVAQQETATAAGTVTVSGAGVVTVTAAGMTGSPAATGFNVSQGTKQVETATVLAPAGITTSGNATVVVTANGMTGSPITLNVAVLQGVEQIETATVVVPTTITGAGLILVTVTGANLAVSPQYVEVYVDVADTADDVATKIRAELSANVPINLQYAVTGAGANIILTSRYYKANDATLNVAMAVDTATGMTAEPTSVNTLAGVAFDTASDVATKIKTAMGLNANIAAWFTIGGTGANVVLTAKAEAANDATMNVSTANGTCAGLTSAPTSVDTLAGVAHDGAPQIATAIRAALVANAYVNAFFVVSGAGNDIILTARVAAANDASMNIAIATGSATGITAAPTSADTTPGEYGRVSVGVGGSFGLPHVLEYAGLLLFHYFDGSSDAGSCTVDPTVSKCLYTMAGTPNGSKLLELWYIAD